MKYIKWPDASENKPFNLGVMGESEVTPYLEKLAETKKAGSRTIVLHRLDTSRINLRIMDMVFISPGYLQHLDFDALIAIAVDENIVLITEEVTFPGGGHINFIEDNNKLFFELDRQALEKAGLRVASELMALARTAP